MNFVYEIFTHKGITSKKWLFRGIFGFVIFPCLVLGVGFVVYAAGGGVGQYESEIKRCLKAREDGKAKSITDFVCPEGKVQTNYDVAYQVVLDMEFQKIDKEVYAALKGFQGKNVKNPLDVANQLTDWFDETGPNAARAFPIRYKKICSDPSSPGNPIYEAIASSEVFPEGITTDGAVNSFMQGGLDCQKLVERKMGAFREMGALIGTKNIVTSYMDDKKTFTNTLNDNYQNLLMQWTIYVGELSRIKSKWNIKTPIQNEE